MRVLTRWLVPLFIFAAVSGGCTDNGGCHTDTDCKGDRVCVASQCAAPGETPDLTPGTPLDSLAPADLSTLPDLAMTPDLASGCLIKGISYPSGTHDPNNPCRTCAPAASTTDWTPADNGSPCGGGLICAGATCVSACYIAGVEWMSGQRDPMNGCEACTPMISTSAWTLLSDGTACGAGKVCSAAACLSGCFIGNAFVTDGTAQPNNPCLSCQSMKSTSQWSSALAEGAGCGMGAVCHTSQCAAGCFIQAQYYKPGDPKDAKQDPCNGCVPAFSTSQFSPLADGAMCAVPGYFPAQAGVCQAAKCIVGCFIGGKIWQQVATNPNNVCQWCFADYSVTDWSDNDGEACGGGKACARQMCVPSWTIQTSGAGLYLSLWGSGPNDIYVAGYDQASAPIILHSSGNGSWTRQVTPKNPNLSIYALWGSGPNDVYAAGSMGTILHTKDGGTTWVPQPSGTAGDLLALWGSGPNDVYAAGANGIMLHTSDSGVTWKPQVSGSTEFLGSLWGSGPGDVYATGSQLTLIHTTGNGTWQAIPFVGTEKRFQLIFGTAANDLYIGCDQGTVLHSTNGAASFTRSHLSPVNIIVGLWGSGPTDIYASAGSAVFHSTDQLKTWTAESIPPLNGHKNGVSRLWGSGPTDVYGIGGSFFAPIILHRP